MNEDLAYRRGAFLAHRRALGRKYQTEEATLRLLRALRRRAPRHRARPAHARVARRVPRLAAEAAAAQLQPPPRRRRRLLRLGGRPGAPGGVAAARPDDDGRRRRGCRSCSTPPRPAVCSTRPPPCRTTPRAAQRGPTYRTIFALCYGLGLRAGEACGLRLGDVDTDRDLLVVVGGKFGKSRLVPHGPRIAELVADQVERRRAAGASDADAPLFSFDGRRSVHPCTASQVFHRLVMTPRAARPRRRVAADAARAPPLLCRRVPAALVSRGARPGKPAPSAVDLHGPRRPRPRPPSTSRSPRRCSRRPTGASRPSPHRRGEAEAK